MDQKGRGKTKTSYGAGGRAGRRECQCTKNRGVFRARHRGSNGGRGEVAAGTPPGRARATAGSVALQNKDGTGNSTSAWLLVSPHPPQLFQVSPSSLSIYTAILVNNPSFKRRTKRITKQNKRKKNKNKKMQTPAHPARACAKEPRVLGPESGGHSFHIPGHSRPGGGGLSDCAGCHHPAGRSLAGKTVA